ncbi:MAG: thioesterase family protein [Phycisphaerae bacterium]
MGPPFRYRFRVTLDDVDYVRVLYFPRQIHFFMLALEEFFRTGVGIPWTEMLDTDRLVMPTVNIDVHYARPLHFGDEADILVQVGRLGEKSFAIDYAVVAAADGQTTCTARHTMAFVESQGWRPIPIPPKYRTALARWHAHDPPRTLRGKKGHSA